MLRSIAVTGAAAIALASLPAPRAHACGGFFCGGPTDPVVQTKEGIIFAVDHDTNEVTALINIAYQGNPTSFAWLLPLEVEPTEISVGATRAFVVADQFTAPRFQITQVDYDGMCKYDPRVFASEDAQAGGVAQPAPPQSKGVEILQQDQVGPYDSVVLRGTDPEAVRMWLVDNGYAVTDEMMQTVVPYIAVGDVLLALKLQKNSVSGDVQPISVKLPGTTEACIPLRMTAIAAQEDMDITAFVLSNRGRAIPDNYLHVTVNLAKIDWLNGGSNYRQVVGQAADEGMGNAFTTEFAGKADMFANQIFTEGQYNIPSLRQATRLNEFLQLVQNQGWQRRPEMRLILLKYIPELADCGSCNVGSLPDRDFDPNMLLDEIEERVIAPERAAQTMFDRYDYLTRLYTLISPHEMGVDPIFSYRDDLPDISNVHGAKLVYHCGLGGTPGSAGVDVILESGLQISFETGTNPNRSILDTMPAASRVESLSSRALIADNSDDILEILGEHNANASGGCACEDSRNIQSGAAGLVLFGAIIGLGFFRRRKI